MRIAVTASGASLKEQAGVIQQQLQKMMKRIEELERKEK